MYPIALVALHFGAAITRRRAFVISSGRLPADRALR
jgi:hypothetical protein